MLIDNLSSIQLENFRNSLFRWDFCLNLREFLQISCWKFFWKYKCKFKNIYNFHILSPFLLCVFFSLPVFSMSMLYACIFKHSQRHDLNYQKSNLHFFLPTRYFNFLPSCGNWFWNTFSKIFTKPLINELVSNDLKWDIINLLSPNNSLLLLDLFFHNDRSFLINFFVLC